MTKTLLDIIDDVRALEDLLDDVDGDISGAEEAVAAFLAENDADLATKVDNYAALIVECEARAALRKSEAKRMADLAKTDEARARWLKQRLQEALDAIGETRVDGPRYRVTVQANGGKAPVCVPDDVDALPAAFVRTKVVRDADKDAIRKALESGADVPGCSLGERGRGVRIK